MTVAEKALVPWGTAVGKIATAMYIGEFLIEGTVVGRRECHGGKIELEVKLAKEVNIMGKIRPVGTILPVYAEEIVEIV
jgi:hypothetical protein